MKITSHAVGVVAVEPQEDGTVLVGRMEYSRHGRTSVRHIMETGEEGETVEHTLYVGTLHEMAADAASFRYHLLSDNPILTEFGACQKHAGGTHMKVFFAVKPIGKLRETPIPDEDETLGPITMVEVRDLLRETEGKTVPIHVRATKAALTVAAHDRKVFTKYQKEVISWKPAELTAEQQAAIDAYPFKW